MTKEEIKQKAISSGRLLYPYPDDIFDEYIDAFIAGANYVNEKQKYNEVDLSEFAEWTSKNRWTYVLGTRVLTAYWRNPKHYKFKNTSDLVKLWKIETGRRKE